MVILQFNKLIRNKWVWGVFAVLVSAAFCFDDLFTTRSNEQRAAAEAGMLDGAKVTADSFNQVRQEVVGFGRNRQYEDGVKTNLETWKRIAAGKVAEEAGIVVSDKQLANAISGMFGGRQAFSFETYRMQLAQQFDITPERFETALRRDIAVRQGVDSLLVGAGTFVSPMEIDLAVADATDKFDVRVARFTFDKAKSDAISVDDEGLKKWYDEKKDTIALPERVKVRFVKFDAKNPDVLAKMVVSEDEMRDQYDATIEKYTSTDTNGVETVKAFEDVKSDIEADLKVLAAIDYFTTNIQRRAYANFEEGEDPKASRLDRIAKEENLAVSESDWFTIDGRYVEGFMQRMESVAPGAREFADAVAGMDPEAQDFRYAVVASDNAVWLLEKTAIDPAHTPTFEEAKDKIVNRALRDARADAFKAEVEAIARNGAEAVLATENVSTNISFSVSNLARNAFPDQTAIVRAAAKLKKGEVSEFVPTGTSRGLLVVCENRQPGDVASALAMRDELRAQLFYARLRDVSEKWSDSILASMKLEAADGYETVDTEADASDAEEDVEVQL